VTNGIKLGYMNIYAKIVEGYMQESDDATHYPLNSHLNGAL